MSNDSTVSIETRLAVLENEYQHLREENKEQTKLIKGLQDDRRSYLKWGLLTLGSLVSVLVGALWRTYGGQ